MVCPAAARVRACVRAVSGECAQMPAYSRRQGGSGKQGWRSVSRFAGRLPSWLADWLAVTVTLREYGIAIIAVVRRWTFCTDGGHTDCQLLHIADGLHVLHGREDGGRDATAITTTYSQYMYPPFRYVDTCMMRIGGLEVEDT